MCVYVFDTSWLQINNLMKIIFFLNLKYKNIIAMIYGSKNIWNGAILDVKFLINSIKFLKTKIFSKTFNRYDKFMYTCMRSKTMRFNSIQFEIYYYKQIKISFIEIFFKNLSQLYYKN